MLVFYGVLFCVIFFMLYLLLVFSFCCFGCVLFSKIKLFGLGMSFDFLVLYSFFFRLINSLQKNKLSSSLSWFNLVWVPWVFFS